MSCADTQVPETTVANQSLLKVEFCKASHVDVLVIALSTAQVEARNSSQKNVLRSTHLFNWIMSPPTVTIARDPRFRQENRPSSRPLNPAVLRLARSSRRTPLAGLRRGLARNNTTLNRRNRSRSRGAYATTLFLLGLPSLLFNMAAEGNGGRLLDERVSLILQIARNAWLLPSSFFF